MHRMRSQLSMQCRELYVVTSDFFRYSRIIIVKGSAIVFPEATAFCQANTLLECDRHFPNTWLERLLASLKSREMQRGIDV